MNELPTANLLPFLPTADIFILWDEQPHPFVVVIVKDTTFSLPRYWAVFFPPCHRVGGQAVPGLGGNTLRQTCLGLKRGRRQHLESQLLDEVK